MSTSANTALWCRTLLGTAILIVLFAIALFGWLSRLGVPEIVRGSTAKGGLWGACPSAEQANGREEALSPKFTARLNERFPHGSPEKNLIDALRGEGFTGPNSCESNNSIKWAGFRLNGNEVVAQAYWKTDQLGRIIWTKGFVAYTFL